MASQSVLSSPQQALSEEEEAFQIFYQKSNFSVPAQQVFIYNSAFIFLIFICEDVLNLFNLKMKIAFSEINGNLKELNDFSISMYLEFDLKEQSKLFF